MPESLIHVHTLRGRYLWIALHRPSVGLLNVLLSFNRTFCGTASVSMSGWSGWFSGRVLVSVINVYAHCMLYYCSVKTRLDRVVQPPATDIECADWETPSQGNTWYTQQPVV